jgi:hypothetical protein
MSSSAFPKIPTGGRSAEVGEIGGLLKRTYDFGFAQMPSGSPCHPSPNEVHATGRLFASPGGGI